MVTLGIARCDDEEDDARAGLGAAAAKVASGDAELLITLVSEILPAPGVELVGPLPMQFQNYVSFAGATGVKAANAAAGKSLVACLSGPNVAATLKAKGIEKSRTVASPAVRSRPPRRCTWGARNGHDSKREGATVSDVRHLCRVARPHVAFRPGILSGKSIHTHAR